MARWLQEKRSAGTEQKWHDEPSEVGRACQSVMTCFSTAVKTCGGGSVWLASRRPPVVNVSVSFSDAFVQRCESLLEDLFLWIG